MTASKGCSLLALLLVAGGGSAGVEAAVRTCGAAVSSGPQTAAGIAEGQRLAIAAWAKAAGLANGERFTSWRLAFSKSLVCQPAATSGVVCEAKAAPCVIEQAPQRPQPPAQRKPPEPRIIPVPPATAPAGPKAIRT